MKMLNNKLRQHISLIVAATIGLCLVGISLQSIANDIVHTNTMQYTITNQYVYSTEMTITQRIIHADLIPVVASAGLSLTNNPAWKPWIPGYISNMVYTADITPTNSNVKVLWGEPVQQIRNIYQGNPPTWNGRFFTYLHIAQERILPGEKLHVIISSINLNENVDDDGVGSEYRIINIPMEFPQE